MDQFEQIIQELRRQQETFSHAFMALAKQVDDITWYHRVGDVAHVDKVYLYGPPPANTTAQSAQDKGNPVKFWAYTFIPRNADKSKKYPMLVFPHGGVHSNFTTNAANVVRELIEQGYLVIAPDYRGSTGYGEMFYNLIDYGGLETEDTFACREWMVTNVPMVDPKRVGILGWSHGGLHTLMNIFQHPDSYKAAYASVPVSDLVARMAYKGPQYASLYSAGYHIGRTAQEDPWEYRRRSPAWHAEKLKTPLLIHTNTTDEDVNVLEVEHLIKALKAEGKQFEYKIYQAAPGGHAFNRLDTTEAVESRKEAYRFLAKYLTPPKPVI